MTPPSETFLFDVHRSGRAPHAVGAGAPVLAWKTWLPSHPARGAESTPAFDGEGNLYFGSHDGCFYSLSAEGRVQWMFKTDEKIYSSPTIRDGVVTFCAGNGFVYAFSLSGEMLWNYDLLGGLRKQNAKKKAVRMLRELPKTMDWGRMYNVTTKSWASPTLDTDGNLYVTGYGSGLISLAPDGTKRWSRGWGGPAYELAGVCLDAKGRIIAVSHTGAVECLSTEGKLIWSKTLGAGENWSCPSYDVERGQAYVGMSWKESRARLVCYSDEGAEKWQLEIVGGLRGTATIGRDDHLLIPALNGRVLLVNRDSGKVQREVILSKDSRGIWANATIDTNGRILLTVKETDKTGFLVCLEPNGDERWRIAIGKALCTPVIDANGRVYVGSWDGYFRAIDTQ